MKKLVVILSVLAITLNVSAQSNVIEAGKSVGAVKLGMSQDEVIAAIGEPCAQRTYAQEEKEIIHFGRNLGQELRYNTHYDTVFEYENAPLPVHKLYFHEGHLVYLTLTAFGYGQATLNQLMLNKGIQLSDIKNITKAFGYPEITENFVDLKQSYFLSQGIDVMKYRGNITAINIYEPIDNQVALGIKEKTGN